MTKITPNEHLRLEKSLLLYLRETEILSLL